MLFTPATFQSGSSVLLFVLKIYPALYWLKKSVLNSTLIPFFPFFQLSAEKQERFREMLPEEIYEMLEEESKSS
jgi:hypothetical protein